VVLGRNCRLVDASRMDACGFVPGWNGGFWSLVVRYSGQPFKILRGQSRDIRRFLAGRVLMRDALR